MTPVEARARIQSILEELDVGKRDVACFAVNMGRVPLPKIEATLSRDGFKKREETWCAFLLDTITSAVDPACTILVHTFSYGYTAGAPFDLQSTPSETGVFSEFVRQQPSAVRSLHPVFSVTGLGPRAESLLSDTGKSGFGPFSPFGRMSSNDAYFVALGTSVGESLTHLHHLEQLHGVNHRYNKLFEYPVSVEGMSVPGPWLCNLRYLSANCEPALENAEAALREAGCLKETLCDEIAHQAVSILDVDRVCGRLIANDQCALLERELAIEIVETVANEPSSVSDRLRFSRVPH